MKRVVYDHRERCLYFASRVLGVRFTDQAHQLGVERDQELVAVVVFDRFTKIDCEIHVASDGSAQWLDRTVMRLIAAYPFAQLGVDRVTCFVPAKDGRTRRFCCRLGFVHEGSKRHPDTRKWVMMFGLLRSDCKWATLPILSQRAA